MKSRLTTRANSSGAPCVAGSEKIAEDLPIEILITRVLAAEIPYEGRSRSKLEVIYEEALNRAVNGNSGSLTKLLKMRNLFDRLNVITKESEWFSKLLSMDTSKMSLAEMQSAHRRLIARSKPLPLERGSGTETNTIGLQIELPLGRALRCQISFEGRNKSKREIMVEVAVNRGINGNFRSLEVLLKSAETLNRACQMAEERKSPFAGIDTDKMTTEELHAFLKKALALQRPAPRALG